MADELTNPPNTFQSQAQQQLANLKRWNQETLQRQAVEMSESVKWMSDMMAKAFGYQNALAVQMADNLGVKTLGHAFPMLASAISGAAGWSPQGMVAATQNAFSQGGMQLQSSDGTYMPLSGYGPAAHMLSAQAWQGVQKNFFHPGGAINLQATHGANANDVADTLNELQRRGAFAGQVAGNIETLTPARLNELKAGASASGNTALFKELEGMSAGDPFVSLNSSTSGRLTSWAQETLKGVQDLRSVLGNLPVSQIMSELERLTGVNISVPGGVGTAVDSLRGRIGTGMAAGMSAQGAMEFASATNATLDQMLAYRTGAPAGSFLNAAAQMGGSLDQTAMAAFLEQRAAGGRRGLGEIATGLASDKARLIAETPELLESTYALGMFQAGSDPHTALLRSMEQFSTAGTVQQREEARRNMALVFMQQTGLRSGALVSNHGVDGLLDNISMYNPQDLSSMSGILDRTNQATMIGGWRRVMGQYDSASPVLAGLGGIEGAAGLANALASTISPQQRNQIQDLVNTGGLQAAQGMLQQINLPGYGNAYTALSSANQNIMAAGGSGVGSYLSYVNQMSQLDKDLQGQYTAGGMASMADQSAAHANAALEYRGSNPLSISAAIEQGLFGGEVPLEDKILLTYGKNNNDPDDVAHLGFNKAHGLDVSKDQLSKIKELYKKLGGSDKDIGRMLNLGKDAKDEDIIKALGTEQGAGTLMSMLGSKKNAILGFGTDDKGVGGVDIALDPDKLRAEHAKETGAAQAAAAQAGAAAQAAGGQSLQLIVDAGAWVQTFMARLMGGKIGP